MQYFINFGSFWVKQIVTYSLLKLIKYSFHSINLALTLRPKKL